jgi:hypothetical protein
MFPVAKSDSDCSSDDDDQTEKSKLLRRPVRIPFVIDEMTSAIATQNRSEDEEDSSGESDDDSGDKYEESESGSEEAQDGEDGLFVIDASGGAGNMVLNEKEKNEKRKSPYTRLDPGVDLSKDLYINLDCFNRSKRKIEKDKTGVDGDSKETDLVTEIMKKATFTSKMEKNPSLPRASMNELKRRRRAEREKTKGSDWFNMPATELTEERQRDLEIMQIRDALDPKSRYRSDDRSVLPKYFQVGTVVEHATDFYHSRIPRKERKQTIVDELLADADFQKRSKRKYEDIVQSKTRYRKRDQSGETIMPSDVKKKKKKVKA